jgi:hypothetical protein
MKQAFEEGSIYIDVTHFEDTGEAFICKFLDTEDLPSTDAPVPPQKDVRVLH